jgi:hypothetical protein
MAKRYARYVIGGLVALLVLAQLVPVAKTNPPQRDVPAGVPAAVLEVLRPACYDCHSNETRWPWYAAVAPMSWLVAHDVNEGREALNFSTWNAQPPAKQAKQRREIWEEVSEGEMPPVIYLPLHPEARLTDAQLAILKTWKGDAGSEADDD